MSTKHTPGPWRVATKEDNSHLDNHLLIITVEPCYVGYQATDENYDGPGSPIGHGATFEKALENYLDWKDGGEEFTYELQGATESIETHADILRLEKKLQNPKS